MEICAICYNCVQVVQEKYVNAFLIARHLTISGDGSDLRCTRNFGTSNWFSKQLG